MCDRCLKEVGKKNLKPAPFVYMNKSDRQHRDVSPDMVKQKRKELMRISGGDVMLTEFYMTKYYVEPGYRQYYMCNDCMKVEDEITKYQNKNRR